VGPEGLLARWCRLLAPFGAPPGRVLAAGKEVLAAYAEAARRYHTAEHVAEVLAEVDDLADLAPHPEAVELAAWLHDVVYDVDAAPGANEASSAGWARARLPVLAVPEPIVARTARLIRLTSTHLVGPDDADGAVLLDADLWILGSSPARYRRYAREVRAEHPSVDDEGWQAGRSAVLEDLARRPRIYATDRAHAARDGRARQNLAWELAALARGQTES